MTNILDSEFGIELKRFDSGTGIYKIFYNGIETNTIIYKKCEEPVRN